MAAKPAPKKITSWSFSRYSDYRQCPLKAKLKHLDKIQEPPNDAMARGAAVHKLAEDYIKGKVLKLDPALKSFEETFKEQRKLFKKRTAGVVVEDDWAFTASWDRTQWNDWVNCVVRIKLDNADNADPDVLIIRDWKTGKFREQQNEEYVEQLELYALAGLLLHPHVKEVVPWLVYVDQGTIYPPAEQPLVFTQDDVPRLKALWAKRTKAMLSDTRFAPKPNDRCRWCFYGQAGKAKGGPGLCKF